MSEKSREKGLVMETAPGEIIVLTPTGEFKNLDWRKALLPEVGSEITFEEAIPAAKSFSTVKLLAFAASLLLCFLSLPLLSSILFPVPSQVVAYVSIDINPSVELGLDEEGIVREVKELNEDGRNLLKTLRVLGHPVEKALRLITDEAAKKHYLATDKDNNILVTYSIREENDQAQVPADTQVLAKLGKVLDAEVKRSLQERNIQVQVELLEISAQIQQQAQEHGLSAGKYAVMLEAQQAGLEINVEDLKFSNVVKAIKDAGGIPGQIISQAKQDEKRLPELAEEMKKREMKENGQNEHKDKGADNNTGNDNKNKDNGNDKQPQQKKEQYNDKNFEKKMEPDQPQNKPGKNVSSSRMKPASVNKANENKSNDNKSKEKEAAEKKADEKNKQGKNVH